MVTFDDAPARLLRACETFVGFDKVERAVLVRDLRGRLRLAIKCAPEALPAAQVAALEQLLAAELGSWFEPPILAPSGSFELRRLRETVIKEGTRDSSKWSDAAWSDPITQVRSTPPPGKWHLVERRLSKLSWTGEEKHQPPWPLVRQRPPIITFYSFKGGVGRTTLLAATAWQLAQEGHRVVAVDLDVEAPGLGSLLGAQSARGVVDFLIDHLATGATDLDDMMAPAVALGQEAAKVEVIQAGAVNHSYFEKLARLDFVGSGLTDAEEDIPVRAGLVALLQAVSRRNPDYILLDSRAGLHDVAGLSLNDLAHVNVLVGRDSDQAYRGLDLTVEALGRRRKFEHQRCVVVQSMAPDDSGSDEYRRITAEYRQRAYKSFSDHIYPRESEPAGQPVDLPELDDDAVAHYPVVVRFNQRLLHFSTIEARKEELFAEDYRRVKERILECAEPEGSS